MVESKDLPKLCKALGDAFSYEQVMAAYKDHKPANYGQVTKDEFVKVKSLMLL